jgi:subtilisin family serine protease
VDLLQTGLDELGRYLALNNCLVVAAAGNDSVAGELRLEPRLPARFETVLGVAATNLDGKPASYSNVGDEQRRGDHVATFGGERGDECAPLDGVTGLYSGEFPGLEPNTTGWASWSGTSFATAIVSGIAANVWASNPLASASEILAEVHELALTSGTYVSELRTPAIALDGEWA